MTWLLALFPAYSHLPGYLHRWKLAAIGRLMVRLHRILTPDGTPYLHTHPFSYVSIVLRGGYTEQYQSSNGSLVACRHRAGAIIIRRATTAHRIQAVAPSCLTLFLAWKKKGLGQGWTLVRHPDITVPAAYVAWSDGLYAVSGGYRRRHGGFWYAKRDTPEAAKRCDRLSIHQLVDEAVPIALP
jgi:hypothetical protein